MNKILPVFLINPEKGSSWLYRLRIIAVLILFLFIAYTSGKSVQVQSDFAVFWQAGVNFSHSDGLYEGIGSTERFIYPPFSAMLFQFFSLFGLQTAGMIWSFINLLMWLATTYVLRQILLFSSIPEKRIKFAMLVGSILSFRYLWYHQQFMQMNLLVLLLSLSGFLLYLKNKLIPALVCLIIATGIKVIPVIFLGWLLTKTHPKVWLKAIGISLLVIIIPILWRGIDVGINDLEDYYLTFLEPFKNGRVEPKLQNYSLAAAIYKLFVPLSVPSLYFTPVFVLSVKAAEFIYSLLMLILLITFSAVILYSRFRVKRISLHEISFVLLFTHLLSGITWEYHLVSLLVVYSVYFSVNRTNATLIQKIIHYLLLLLMIFNALVGMDTVGKQFYYISCGYSFLTILMLLLLTNSAFMIFRAKQNPEFLLNRPD